MSDLSPSRRRFVKRSLAVGVAAAQPAFLAGLVRASGGDGGSGYTKDISTTDPYSAPPDTTMWTYTTLPPETTYMTTTGY